MECRTIADANGFAAAVSVKVMENAFGDIRLTTYGEHDGQTAVRTARLDEALHDELHVRVGLCPKAQTEEDVDSEARVADPRVSIIPVPHTPNVFGDGERGRRNDGTSRFL